MLGATYSAARMEIGFNAQYLLDITSQIEGKEMRFLLSDAGSPTIIEDAEDARSLYVLMPHAGLTIDMPADRRAQHGAAVAPIGQGVSAARGHAPASAQFPLLC